MFSPNSVNKKYILMYMNYRNYSNTSELIIQEDFDIKEGRYNGEPTVRVIPSGSVKFIPFILTETYYNDVVLFIVSSLRIDKIEKIIK